MSWHFVEKEFYDYADDIEGVNIHYVWTPLGAAPEWEHQRLTRYMPLVQAPSQLRTPVSPPSSPPGSGTSFQPRLRKKVLKLPQQIEDPESGTLTDRYLLHHYFEIFQNGHRQYSPLYTEEIVTGANTPPSAQEVIEEEPPP